GAWVEGWESVACARTPRRVAFLQWADHGSGVRNESDRRGGRRDLPGGFHPPCGARPRGPFLVRMGVRPASLWGATDRTTEGGSMAMRGSEEARAAGAWPQAGASAGQEAPRREEERGAGERAVRVARGLGLASLGLGVAGIAAPRRLAELIGLGRDPAAWTILRVIGGREIAAGLGLLRRPRDTGRLWARVVGDAMDLALLGTALRLGRGDRGRLATATAVTAGVALIDVMAARRLGRAVARQAGTARRAIHVARTVTINRAPDVVYRFWRELENLPRFMTHRASVRAIDDRRSRWTVKGPAGSTVSWEAEICDDRPGELLSWRSVGAAEVPNAGTVWFTRAPGGRGTEVRV